MSSYGDIKDAAGQNFESAERRRVRGTAAQGLITCFMVCAENLRKIVSWANDVKPDTDGRPALPLNAGSGAPSTSGDDGPRQ